MRNKIVVLLATLVFFLTGCVFQSEVQTNQMSVDLYKNEIVAVRGPGVYTHLGCFFCDLKTVDVDTLTFSVEDPEVLTKDNQAVGEKITIQARRKADDASVKNIFTNWSTYTNDDVLKATISATALEGMKNGTRVYTLTELLDDRNGLADAISKSLEEDAKEYSVEIVNVTIANIAPSTQYMAILSETANIKAQTDQEIRRQDLINQKAKNSILEQEKRVEVANAQVVAEQAETKVQVEIANRQGEIVAASNQVYADNPQAFELHRLELLKDVIGDKTVIYLPSDALVTLLTGNSTSPFIPLPQPQTQP